MQIVTSFEDLPKEKMAFTVGTFDGLHLGHQAIFSKLGSPSCVVTFVEHPMKTLCPGKVPPIITPLPLKLSLLKTDYCLLLEFAKIASWTFDEFLNRLPASHIVLGQGSRLGRRREGTESNLRAWGVEHGVPINYIEKLPGISSTEIRNAIQEGDFPKAEKLLGRPHLLYAPCQIFSGTELVLPPEGVYPLHGNECTIKGGTIHLTNPVTKPTIYSFNEEFHV